MPRPPVTTIPTVRAALAALVAVLCAAAPALAAFTGVVERAGNGAVAAAAFAPVVVAPPEVTGRAVVGERLAVAVTWARDPVAITYAWERCDGDACVAVGQGATYLVTPADAGSRLRVSVTAENAGGAATATSALTDVVAAAVELAHAAAPAITGTAVVDDTLTVVPGGWPSGATLTYRWQRCAPQCDVIDGASATTYRPTLADVGATLRVVETARLDGSTASASSAPTDAVRSRYRHAILTSLVVAHWPFDEPGGPAFADILGGPAATLAGPGASVPGLDPPSPALELAGGQLTVPSTTATTPTESFGVEAWVRPTTTANATIVSKVNDALTNGYALEIANGRFRFRVIRGGTRSTAFGDVVRPGEWTYVSANHQGSSMLVWTNGVAGETVTAAKPGATTVATRIGPLSGTIDEVALYRANLSANRIGQRWTLLKAAAGHGP